MDIAKEYPLRDAHGERYREIGRGIREYAPRLVTTAGEVPAGTVIVKAEQAVQHVTGWKDCPLKTGLYPRCTEECAFFMDGECNPGIAQTGKRCPLPAHLTCGASCMMNHNGRCAIFAAERNKK